MPERLATAVAVLAFALASVIVSFPSPAHATQRLAAGAPYDGPLWYVALDGDDETGDGSLELPFETIQQGIASADSGHTVLIADGTYTGEGNREIDFLGKEITVRSLSGIREHCIIDAEGNPDTLRVGFRFDGEETRLSVLESVTVTGGYPAGIYCGGPDPENASSPTIRDVLLELNPGAGMIAEGVHDGPSQVKPRIVSALVRKNAGGGIRFDDCGVGAIDSCEVVGNGAVGIELLADSWWPVEEPLVVEETWINDNVGTGVQFSGSQDDFVELRRCKVLGNGGWGVSSSGWTAGLHLADSFVENNTLGGVTGVDSGHRVTIARSQVCDNRGVGVAVDLLSWYFGLEDSHVSANDGAGVVADFFGLRTEAASPRVGRVETRTITGCVISDNGAMGIELGGGLASGLFTVSHTLLSGNTDGGIRLGTIGYGSADGFLLHALTIADNSGPGIDYASPDLACTLTNTIIADNTGPAIATAPAGLLTITCTDIHGNEGGDWTGALADFLGVDGNLAVDPLFCDPPNDDYHVYDVSPCLPGQHPDGEPCDQIGKYGQGCTGVGYFQILAAGAPIPCGGSTLASFRHVPGADTPPIRGYEARVVVSGPAEVGVDDVTVATVPPDATVFFDVLENGPGDLTVTYAILGDTGGIVAEADLFDVTVHGTSEGDALVALHAIEFRDLANVPITMAAGPPATITVDCSPPAPVSDVAAAPGHNAVTVNWTHDAVDVDHFEVFRALWYQGDGSSAYPEYDDLPDDVVPDRPADHPDAVADPDWTLVDSPPAGTNEFADAWPDGSTRGIYLYEVFAVDAAANPSPAADAGDRATNYWLADIDGDGDVDVLDVDTLGNTFNVGDGHASYDNRCDVGPTDDWSGFGIPDTDDVVDFEDLMIFAVNFGAVAPGGSDHDGPAAIWLAWEQQAPDRWVLRLTDGEALQGLRLRGDLPPDVGVTVTGGDLLDDQPHPTFLRARAEGLDISLALLASGQTFAGQGVLLVVETDEPAVGLEPVIDARGTANDALVVNLDQVTPVSLPSAFALGNAFPNPFNPRTRIRFALPEARAVDLAIYSLAGRHIATLARGEYPAGVHEVTWRGRDDHGRPLAAGTYFYRISAGSFREVKKLTIVR